MSKQRPDLKLTYGSQSSGKGRKGIIGLDLTQNIARLKQPDLFDTLKPEDRALYIPVKEGEGVEDNKRIAKLPAEASLILADRKGKSVILTSQQLKIICGLCYELTPHLEEEDIKETIEALEKGIMPKRPIVRNVNLNELSALLYGTTRQRDIDLIKEELSNLSATYQYVTFKHGGKTAVIQKPLITITGRSGSFTEEELSEIAANRERVRGRKKGDLSAYLDEVEILYNSIFFSGLMTRYGLMTRELFSIWGKKGNGTSTNLWVVVLTDVYSKYTQYTNVYKAKLAAINKKYKNKNTKAAREEKAALKNTLIYRVDGETLKARTVTDYSSIGKAKRRFVTDIEKIVATLVEYGIITAETQIIDNKGKVKINFHFNPYFAKETPQIEEAVEVRPDNEAQAATDEQ